MVKRESKANLIAVVDDDDLLRSSIADLLMSAGFEPRTFASAEEFLECSEMDAMACLVTDIRMSGMTGLELQRKLTGDGWWLPTIFITALEDTSLRSQALRGGAVEFLLKPIDDAVLLCSVEAALKSAFLERGGRR
jgi:FixJ family two-component response regulator